MLGLLETVTREEQEVRKSCLQVAIPHLVQKIEITANNAGLQGAFNDLDRIIDWAIKVANGNLDKD